MSSKASRLHRMRRASHFPLRKLFSSRLWKIWGVGLLTLLAGAGVIAATWGAMERPGLLGPGLVQLFHPSSSRMVPYFNSVLLALSGQVAMLIWWARSRSLHDFSAQYRVWAWSAAADFTMAVCVATGAHHAWSKTISWLWIVDFPNKELWFWLGPACVWGGVLFRLLKREMRECRSSLTLWWLSTLCFAVLGVWQFGDLPRWLEGRVSVPVGLIESGILTLGCVLLLQCMLLHARHVIHKSVEPPEARQSRMGVLLSKLSLSRLISRRGKSASEDGEAPKRRRRRKQAAVRKTSKPVKDASAEDVSSDDEDTTPEESETRLARSAETVRAGGVNVKGSVEPRGGTFEKPSPRPVASATKTPDDRSEAKPSRDDSTVHRTDGALDRDAMQGLSKKERRRLKQQRREELRKSR